MKYKIIILKRAMKFIEKQPPELREKILKGIYNLPNGDVKALRKYKMLYRLRIGNVRVIYTIDNQTVIIKVIDAGNRGQIYNKY